MAIAQGSTVTYSDINTVMTNVANAYNKTTTYTVSWNPTPSQGGLLQYSILSQINSYGSSANNSYRSIGCSSNYANNGNTFTANSKCSFCTNNQGFTNNKCGGEYVLWLGFQ